MSSQMNEGVAIKGRYIIIQAKLQVEMLEHLHSNHMGIEKTRLLA